MTSPNNILDELDVQKGDLEGLLHPSKNQPIRVGMLRVKTDLDKSRFPWLVGSEDICDFIVELSSTGDYDIIVGSEYTFNGLSGPLTLDEMESYKKRLIEASSAGVAIIPGSFVVSDGKRMQNIAYVFNEGREIFQYLKIQEGGEVQFARKKGLSYIAGDKPGLFDLFGFKCGIEICADKGVLVSKGVKDLDIYFRISSGTLHNYASIRNLECVRDGGYCVFIDGCNVDCRITRRNKK